MKHHCDCDSDRQQNRTVPTVVFLFSFQGCFVGVSVGSTTVSSCSACDQDACASAFPSQCPATGASGLSGSSCSSGTSSGGTSSSSTTKSSSTGTALSAQDSTGADADYDPSVWLGTYSVSGCDTDDCCCLTSVKISQFDSSNYQFAGPVSGECGTTTSASFEVAIPTSNTYSYTLYGQTHSDVLSGDIIYDTNLDESSCSGTLYRSAAVAASDASKTLLMIAGILALTATQIVL